MHWLWVPQRTIVLLSASERQGGVVLGHGCDLNVGIKCGERTRGKAILPYRPLPFLVVIGAQSVPKQPIHPTRKPLMKLIFPITLGKLGRQKINSPSRHHLHVENKIVSRRRVWPIRCWCGLFSSPWVSLGSVFIGVRSDVRARTTKKVRCVRGQRVLCADKKSSALPCRVGVSIRIGLSHRLLFGPPAF